MIPSLGIGDRDESKSDALEAESSKPPSPKVSCKLYFFILRGQKKGEKKT